MLNNNKLERVAFCTDMSVGIRDIDLQHKGIFEIHNKFVDEYNESKEHQMTLLRCTMNDLFWYAKYHFREEEWLMRTYNFPFTRAHVDQHQELAEMLKIIRFRDLSIAAYVNALDNFIDIFAEHILRYDLEYAKFICS